MELLELFLAYDTGSLRDVGRLRETERNFRTVIECTNSASTFGWRTLWSFDAEGRAPGLPV